MAKGTEIWVCPQCGFRMDIAPLGLYAEVQCPRCFRSERVHAQLGNFRLDAVLGVGGMSVVYRAFDVVLHRALALKVLNDTFRDQPERIERFENESAMMARVRHENVTSVYSAGRAYGQFYIAMELVEGKNLEYMVTAEQPMGAHQALDIIRQVTLGLRAAHEAGLLHRDMKPGNVLITPEGSAKVIDFGLAMDSREDDTEEIIWATPYYVPPETLKREPEDVRTDIYALGMTLRFLLTGIESFNEEANSLQALIQCKRKLVPLSKQRSGIPAALSELVDHMTEFAAADRPANYDELLAEIEEVQRELTSGSTPAAGRNRLLVRGGGVVASLALGALLGAVFTPSAPPQKHALISLPASGPENRGAGEVMPGVLSQLKNGNYGDAVKTLLTAADRESDPCLGAWYAQLARTILCSCYDDASAATSARDIFLRHLDAGSRVQPAAARSFAALKTMDTQRYPSARDWEQHSGDWSSLTRESINRSIQLLEQEDMHPILKVLKWGVLSRKAAWHGDADLEESCLSKIKAEAPSLGKYSVLAEMLSKTPGLSSSAQAGSETAAPSSATKATAKRFTHTPKDGGLNKAQSQVYEEVATMADAMLKTLQRKHPEANMTGMSDEELIKLALGLSPAARSAVWADASQPGHSEVHAIDGRLDTRWCANNGDGGHSFVLDIDTPEIISAVILHWEQSIPLYTRARVYSSGEVLAFDFDRNKMVSRLNVKGRRLDRLELSFPNGGGQGNWAGVVEVQLLTEDGRLLTPDPKTGRNDFADELRAVLLMMSGQYEAAFKQMAFVIAREGEDSPFGIIAADWKYRWFGATEVVDAAPSLPTLPPQVAPPSTSDMPIVGLLKRMSPALRETWIAEKFSLIFMPDGSSPKDERQWTRRGTIYLGSDGQKYDFWDRFNKAYDRENLWGIAADVLRKEYKPTLEAVAKAFPELIGQMALHSAYYHLSEMSPLVRESLLAELAGLLTLPGNSRSAYTGKPGESNAWDAPIPLREYSDRARFRDSKGAERTVSKYKPNSGTSDSVSREKVYIAAYLLGVEKVLALYPNVVSALRKNNPEATKFPVSSPQPYLKI